MDPGPGPSKGRGNRGRGNNNWRRWMYKKRGRGAARGASGSSSSNAGMGGSSSGGSNDSQSPTPTRKKRTDSVQNIKTAAENQWKNLLPGYQLYYKSPPQISEIKEKVTAIAKVLNSFGFDRRVSEFEADTVGGNKLRNANELKHYEVDVDQVLADEEFTKAWQNFNEELTEMPEEIVKIWGATAHKVAYEALLAGELETDEDSDEEPPCVCKIVVGFFKSKPVIPLIDIKSDMIGKFVTVKGAVIRTGGSRVHCTQMTFRCKYCDMEFPYPQPNGIYTQPTRCPSEECRNKSHFEFLENSPTTIVMDSRRIRIQDILCNTQGGSIPSTMDCLLLDDLSDKCSTGDVISLCGIVKAILSPSIGREQPLQKLHIEVLAVKQHRDAERTMGGNLFSFSDKDYYAVKAIHDTPDLFRFLVLSLCPSIYGHELVKAGLLLSLFGGTVCDGFITRRSDINMLMVGDPGLGKSQMLKVVSEVAPRAVYVCGSGSTVAGLTVTLVRDGDEQSVEAGALVLADKGVCCIDEFDKMSSQHSALLEAMEQQSVTVAKSGIYKTLPARTTVIAAANPVGGHYNRGKTVSENIKIDTPLLSRFDLVFIILDTPDETFDKKVFEHIRNFRRTANSANTSAQATSSGSATTSTAKTATTPVAPDLTVPLRERLKPREGEVLDLLPPCLLRKYIAYAKQYVHPKITSEAANALLEYYKDMRAKRRGPDCTPITSRQLESLARLTEARAKLELREEATLQDAREILEIFEFSMSSPLSEDVLAVSSLSESVLLNSTSQGGSKKSLAAQARKLCSALQSQAKRLEKNVFSLSEIKSITAALGLKCSADSLIATLNNEGVLLNKGGGTYKLQTV